MAKRLAVAAALALLGSALLVPPSLARIGEQLVGAGEGAPRAHGDFDGDGCEDLAVGAPRETAPAETRTEGVVLVFHGRGPSCRPSPAVVTLRPPAGARVQDFGGVLAAGDFDRDGTEDLAATATLLPEFGIEVFALRGSPAGLASEPAVRLSALLPREVHADMLRAQALSVADFDADGSDDLAIAVSLFWHYEVVVLFGRGARESSLSFALARARFDAPGATDERLRMTAGDFDRNGFADLAVARLDASEVRFHYSAPDPGPDLASWRMVTRLVPVAQPGAEEFPEARARLW